MTNNDLLNIFQENIFELTEDTTMEYLVHYYAPYTGADSCVVPSGTQFAFKGLMRGDAAYLNPISFEDTLIDTMKGQLRKGPWAELYERLQGFSFYITVEQLKTIPIRFCQGSLEDVFDIWERLRTH